MTDLTTKRCVPCEVGGPPLTRHEAEVLLQQVPDWALGEDGKKISRTFTFKDFAEALHFTDRVGAIAETEGHHPDIHLSWGKVTIELYTHAVGGLSENDFIVAAKIDRI